MLCRKPLANLDVTWWSAAHGDGFLRYELAGRRVYGDWSRWARRIFNVENRADWLEYSDVGTGVYRCALVTDNRIDACMFISARPDLPSRIWLSGLFAKPRLTDADRAGMLTGRAAQSTADTGPIVCSCFGVSRGRIEAAIEQRGLKTSLEVGKAVRAGTNCGSCVSEIRALLAVAEEKAESGV